MGLLTLDTPLEIEVKENGQLLDTLKITYRYPTKSERKDFDEYTGKMQELFSKMTKLESASKRIEKRIEYAEKLEDYKKAEKLLTEQEKLEKESEELTKEVEENGGDDFQEKTFKMMFDVLVGGTDKEKLGGYADRVGYERIIQLLNQERDNFEKKQRGQ